MYLIGIEDKIIYDRQNNKLNMLPQEVNAMFTGSETYGFTKNRATSVFQLGWDSVVTLVENEGKLHIEKIEELTAGNFVDITQNFCPLVYDTVITRAVDFCTFIHFTKGNKHVLVHFDEYDCVRENKLMEIAESMRDGYAFVSLIPDEKKYLEIIANANIKNSVMLRSVDNKVTYKKGVPGDLQLINYNIFGHLEIGLTINNGQVCLIGDVTNRLRGDKQFPYFRFLGKEAAFDAVVNLLNFKESR